MIRKSVYTWMVSLGFTCLITWLFQRPVSVTTATSLCSYAVSQSSGTLWKVHVHIYQSWGKCWYFPCDVYGFPPRAPPGAVPWMFTGAVVQQPGVLTVNSLLAAHYALLAASQPANHMDPSPRAEQEERGGQQTGEQKQPTRPAAGSGKAPQRGSGAREKKAKLQVFLFRKASYMAFLYLTCLCFFMENRTINTKRNWQEGTLSQP